MSKLMIGFIIAIIIIIGLIVYMYMKRSYVLTLKDVKQWPSDSPGDMTCSGSTIKDWCIFNDKTSAINMCNQFKMCTGIWETSKDNLGTATTGPRLYQLTTGKKPLIQGWVKTANFYKK